MVPPVRDWDTAALSYQAAEAPTVTPVPTANRVTGTLPFQVYAVAAVFPESLPYTEYLTTVSPVEAVYLSVDLTVQ